VPRIVSLLPAATDIVAALGRSADLVGVTWECTVPEGVPADLRVVTRDLLAVDDPSDPAAVDAAVQAASEARQPLAAVDDEAVAALAPEVVLTQDLCRVCALPAGQATEALERLGCTDARVVSLDPMTLDDVLASVIDVGAAIGAEVEAAALVAGLRARLDALPGADGGDRPSAVVVEWVDPLFVGGHWIPDLVDAAGARSALGTPGGRSSALSWDEVTNLDVDHVVVAPCGFDLDGASAQAQTVLDRVPAGASVWAIDADQLIVRPGPRLVEGAEVLAAAFAGRPTDQHLLRRIR
jgi:iron complex transport system substrate-binding protein